MLLRWSLSIDEVLFCNENEVKMRLKQDCPFRNSLVSIMQTFLTFLIKTFFYHFTIFDYFC